MSDYTGMISFIKELERLKDITRTAWTSQGRQESVAEHSWRLCLFAFVLEDHFPETNIHKVIQMCLIHDLGEAYEGDVSAKIETNQKDKLPREKSALLKLLSSLSEHSQSKFLSLWKEYVAGESKEAKLAKALDKMETIIQHNQGKNPSDFDYEFNLQYGRDLALHDSVLRSIRDLIDNETLHKVNGTGNR
ncbi:MAG: HD domain-containing protein [Clostridia bacterium]|nr:HD domain-containing protein [Clostridia bacterium]